MVSMQWVVRGALCGLLAFSLGVPAKGQENTSFWGRTKDFSIQVFKGGAVKVGLNVGATAPLGVPEGVSVVSYAPNFAPVIALERDIDLHKGLFFSVGIQFEYKGMRTRAAVHDFYTEVEQADGDQVVRFAGSFTGDNVTSVNNAYATLPLRLGLRVTKGVSIKVGGYVSWALSTRFSGAVENGYVWTKPDDGSTTSNKIEVTSAQFDFSNKMGSWDFGVNLQSAHYLTDRFFLDAGLSFGLISTLQSSFTGVSFPMYNMYLTVGAGYKLFDSKL